MLLVSLREASLALLNKRLRATRVEKRAYARSADAGSFAGELRPPTPPMRKTHFAYGSLVLRFAIQQSPSVLCEREGINSPPVRFACACFTSVIIQSPCLPLRCSPQSAINNSPFHAILLLCLSPSPSVIPKNNVATSLPLSFLVHPGFAPKPPSHKDTSIQKPSRANTISSPSAKKPPVPISASAGRKDTQPS